LTFRRIALAHELAGATLGGLARRRSRGIEIERIFPARGGLKGRDTQALTASLRAVDAAASGWDAPAYWAGRPGFLNEIHVLLLARVEGELAGFCALQWLQEGKHRFVYVDATAVLPEHQNGGTATRLIAESFLAAAVAHAGRPFLFALRTESPVVYSAFYGVFGTHTYPQLDDTPPGLRVAAAAGAVAEYLGQGASLDVERLVIRGAHQLRGSTVRPPLPRCRTHAIQSYFDRHVDINSHDALLMLVSGNLWSPVIAAHGLLRRRREARTRQARVVQHDVG